MRKTKFVFEVCEIGCERHDGEFDTTFLRTDNLANAFVRYQEELKKIKTEHDFFLEDMLDEAEETTHTPDAFDYAIDLPVFGIYDDDNGQYYELTIRVVEVEVTQSKKYAIVIARKDYEEFSDELSRWNDYYPILFVSREKAETQMKALLKAEFDDLVVSRGNDNDYFTDDTTNTIFDGESGYDIAVATYSIIEFDDTEEDYE